MSSENKFTEKLLTMANEDPDQCLDMIAKMVESNDSMLSNPLIRVSRAISYTVKGANLYSSLNQYSNEVLDLYEKSLIEFKSVNELSPEKEFFSDPDFVKKIDLIAIQLEPFKPVRVQELLGVTKLTSCSWR